MYPYDLCVCMCVWLVLLLIGNIVCLFHILSLYFNFYIFIPSLGDHMGCCRLNFCQLYVRQASYPDKFFLYLNNSIVFAPH